MTIIGDRSLWFTHELAPIVLVLALISVNLIVKEHFPFSHFPMYATLNAPRSVYYFLTTEHGVPVPVRYLTGGSSEMLKKIVNSGRKEFRQTANGRSSELAGEREAAQRVLTRLRDEAGRKPALPRWPAGIQLWRAQIENRGDEFHESFVSLASTLEAGPEPGVEFRPSTHQRRYLGIFEQERVFAELELVCLGGLAILLLGWKRLPTRYQGWLSAGIGPGQVGRLEAFFLRLGLAFVLWKSIGRSATFSTIPHPKGLALIEGVRPLLLWLGHPAHQAWVWAGALGLLIWYVVGRALILPLTLLTGIHILRHTLVASQGADGHGHQLISLVFLAQTVQAWMGWSSRRDPSKTCRDPGNETRTWLAMALMIAVVYGTCGVVKLISSRGQWLFLSHHIATEIVKTHRQQYYSDLDPQFGEALEGAPAASMAPHGAGPDRYRLRIPAASTWMAQHPHLTRIFLAPGLFLELLAVFLFLGRGTACLFGLVLITFHVLVQWLMIIGFSLNMETIWVVLVNVPGWMIWWKFRSSFVPTARGQSESSRGPSPGASPA